MDQALIEESTAIVEKLTKWLRETANLTVGERKFLRKHLREQLLVAGFSPTSALRAAEALIYAEWG
jgi:hypothetical protein